MKIPAPVLFIKNFIGKDATTLIEEYKDGYNIGHTDNFIKLYIKDKESKIGQFIKHNISIESIKNQ
jgi:hypothetical protein